MPLSAWQHYHTARFNYLLIAALVYVTGTLAVTLFGNVPLNNALANVDPASATAANISAARLNFESRWNTLHTIRTLASVASLVLVLIACLISTDLANSKQ